jgi:hypothetical protein
VRLHLRLICAVTPLAVAGLRFGRGPVRAYGVIVQPLDQFDEGQLRELFAEPRIDVSVGMEMPTGDWAFVPAADILDLARLQQLLSPPIEQPEPPRDTLQVIADHHRIELERGRDAAAPGGDDEGAGDQASTDTTGAAPSAPAALGDAAPTTEAPTKPAAEGGSSGTSATTLAYADGTSVDSLKPAALSTPPTTSLAPPEAPVRRPRAPRAPAKK